MKKLASPKQFNFDDVDRALLQKRAPDKWGKAQGDAISLSVADMDYPIAEEIKLAIRQALDEERTFYGDYQGDEDVLQTVCEKFARQNKMAINPADVYLIPGAMFGIHITCQLCLRPGDEALIVPSPVYGPYFTNIKNAGAIAVGSDLNMENRRLDLADVKKKISKKTKLLMLCNPHNPTGTMYTRTELETLAELAQKHNLTIFSDELYEDMVYEGQHISIASFSKDLAQRTITVCGFSKAFNVAGLRIAYAVNQGEWIKAMRMRVPSMIVHVDRLAQAAAKAALTTAQPWLAAVHEYLIQMRDYAFNRIQKISGLKCVRPAAGPFLFIDVRSFGMTSTKLAGYLEKKAGVIVVPGTAFGPSGEGYIRINFATSKAILTEALDRLAAAFESLPSSL